MMQDTSHLHITFFNDAVKLEAASKKEGRPIFEDQEFVRIKFVGDNKRELVAPAHEKYRMDREAGGQVSYAEDFPRHYQAFKDGETQATIGTPIEELPFITAAKRSELKALNVNTAEALAQLDGTNLQRLGIGGRELKNQAQAYIDHAKDTAGETRLAGENAALKEQMEALMARMHEMELAAEQRSGPGPAQTATPTPVAVTEFADWPDDELRKFIKDKTGAAPRGQPAHDTLVSMAEQAAERRGI